MHSQNKMKSLLAVVLYCFLDREIVLPRQPLFCWFAADKMIPIRKYTVPVNKVMISPLFTGATPSYAASYLLEGDYVFRSVCLFVCL